MMVYLILDEILTILIVLDDAFVKVWLMFVILMVVSQKDYKALPTITKH